MYAIIDIETTGNNHKYGQITEIAVIQHDGNSITNSYQTLIRPDMDIPYFITKLTGITNHMIEHAPKFYEVARKVVELTEGRMFIAHNVQFDYNFIREEFKRLGYHFHRKTLCTVTLARRFLPNYSSYSLGSLCSELGITVNGRHRAAGDAFATTELFEILLKLSEKRQSSGNYRLF